MQSLGNRRCNPPGLSNVLCTRPAEPVKPNHPDVTKAGHTADEQERPREEPEIAQSVYCSKWPSLHEFSVREHASIVPASSWE